jgi:hypothetical protein
MKTLAYTLIITLMMLVGLLNPSRCVAAGTSRFPTSSLRGSSTAAPVTGFAVTNLNDSGSGSLRQAVLNANANPGADEITFNVTGTITLTTGELLITDKLTILGPGASLLTVSGNNASRVFNIIGANVTIAGLTISNGNVGVGSGGGIRNEGGTLTVTNSTVSGNFAGSAGGISGFGTTAVTNSTVSGNTASTSGGGISNNGGLLLVTNSTISGNFANEGGGISDTALNPTTTIISNSTLVNNIAVSGAGLRYRTTYLKNSIIANNTGGANCLSAGTLTVSGINFATDNTCPGLTQVTSAQLNLGPLANNGGSTLTHALLAGSVAIDAVTDCTDLSAVPVTTDQRGVSRPLDGDGDGTPRCDAGAYEAPAMLFDLCIQDDSNGNRLQVNSTTGAYQFTNCSGFTLGGTGTLTKRGSILTLQHISSDRRVTVTVDTSSNRATASIQLLSQGKTFTITDRNILNNSCACN